MSAGGLAGRRILVVEDDYYLASDAETTLAAAGAAVLGPCSDEESGLALAGQARIDCAVLDVNLGPGPSFRLARAMRARGIPVLFVTGYDRETIPTEFSDVPWLQKPYREDDLVRAIGILVRTVS